VTDVPRTGARKDGGRTTVRRARGSLSEDEILDASLELVERHGLQELTMPALAKHLKSGVTSIYWYFRSKDELLDALTDRVTREMYRSLPPIGAGPWDGELVEYFVAFRQMLDETPIYREVFAYRARSLFARAAIGPAMLRRLEEGLSLLVRGGLTPDQAADAFNACSNYTRGFVLLKHGMEREVEDRAFVWHLDPEEFPTLNKISNFDRIMWLDDQQFRLGLRLLVEGLSREYSL
jgi:AcrR family transcriptional regulator